MIQAVILIALLVLYLIGLRRIMRYDLDEAPRAASPEEHEDAIGALLIVWSAAVAALAIISCVLT